MNIEDNNPTEQPNSQPEFDTSGALADISSELFGQDDGGDQEGASGLEPKAGTEGAGTKEGAVVGTEPAPSETENSEAVIAAGAPKTWSKEALADWATVPERAKQEILKREEDMHRGMEQYRGRAEVGDRYSAVVEPYKPAMEAAGIDPIQLTQSFAANHYLLSFGKPEQKAELAASMLQGYGIDLNLLANILGNARPADPALQRVEAELNNVKQQLSSRDQQTALTQVQSEVDAFAADPAHQYFDELQEDIVKFINQGETLKDAYDKAVYANPVTRQKEIDRLTAERSSANGAEEKARRDKQGKFMAAEVSSVPKPRGGTVAQGSIDDTLAETLAAITGRG